MKNSPVAYALLAGLTLCIFALDLITPLGVAVWILYVVPIALTLFGQRSDVPVIGAITCTVLMLLTLATDSPGTLGFWVAALNRVCGIVVIWTLALLAHNLLETRNRLRDEEWIRAAQTALLEDLQGERVSAEIGAITLRHLSSALDAPVGAVYAFDGDVLRLAATQGLAADVDVPGVVVPGAGLVGEAARGRSTLVVDAVPPGYFEVHSALGRRIPSHLVITPLSIDGTMQGVMELGLFTRPSLRAMTLLERVSDGVGVTLRSAAYRERMRSLLMERQRQAEELQAQQEELRVTNEELEEQSRALKASQARLEEQQADLETSNAQLSIQASELEQQKRTLQAARVEAERASQYKSDFLANMSHELRTPLNSSLILARLLADNKGGRLSDEQVRYAETIYSSGNNLLTLINDILDLSKIEAGAVEIDAVPTSLPELAQSLRQTFAPLAADKGLALSIDVAADVPGTITTDRVRLKQILTNLLSNAMKFTERGEVAVTVTRQGVGHVAFAVRDTGIGIPDDKREVIFKPFMQAHAQRAAFVRGHRPRPVDLARARPPPARRPGRGEHAWRRQHVHAGDTHHLDGAGAEAVDGTAACSGAPRPPVGRTRVHDAAGEPHAGTEAARRRRSRRAEAAEPRHPRRRRRSALRRHPVRPRARSRLRLCRRLVDRRGHGAGARSCAHRHPARRRPARRLGVDAARPVEAQPRYAAHPRPHGVGERLHAHGHAVRRDRVRAQAGAARGARDGHPRARVTDHRTPQARAGRRRRRAAAREHPPVADHRRRDDRRRRVGHRGAGAPGVDELRLRGARPEPAGRQRLRRARDDERERTALLPAGDHLHGAGTLARRGGSAATLLAIGHHQGRAVARAPARRGDAVPAPGGVAPATRGAAAVARLARARRVVRGPGHPDCRRRRAERLRPDERVRATRRDGRHRTQRARGDRARRRRNGPTSC